MQEFYPNTSSDQDITKIEEKILEFWKREDIFDKSVKKTPIKKENTNNNFIFYDGPPFANGMPHYGHLLTGFIKDLYARFHTTLGKRVERVFGWDCHGLPAEMQTEKELKLSGAPEIKKYGVEKFNAHCRNSVLKYSKNWQEYITRQGRWVNFENSYKTMDINFMESVLWTFKQLYNKGLVYHEEKVVPYSVACQTPVSNFETRMDNSYRTRIDKTVSASLKLTDTSLINTKEECRLIIWTTTPWTLVSNLAVAVNERIQYVLIKKEDKNYILAKSRLKNYKKEFENAKIILSFSGKKLVGLKYQPLFNYFKGHKNAFKILHGEFVTEENGTGIVHIAPAFGEDDNILCKKHSILPVCPITDDGIFKSSVSDLKNIHIFKSTDLIIKKLKDDGNWIKTENYSHKYPHCWRTDTPLIYKIIPSWYVKVSSLKEKMIKINQQINWVPNYVKNNLFGKWLEGAKDWVISRNRFWGTPIPVWISDDPQYPRIDVYGSIKEIEKDFNIKINNLHKPFIDSITRKNPDDPSGKSKMKRIEDIFDCWFESGCMPHAKLHYPFENKDVFEKNFPADFITEYLSQTRGWFYTLIVIAASIFNKPPFLNCICHGVVLDKKGQKLSKRLNNYEDPKEIFKKYGAEALRITMLSSSALNGEELLLDNQLIRDSVRLSIKPIWQSYHFFCMYANADKIRGELKYEYENVLDKYIIYELICAVRQIKKSLLEFNTQNAYKLLNQFFDSLNNWYIRRNRERFWQKNLSQNKADAYNVLFTCLFNISKASSSLIPIISEEIYQGITKNTQYFKQSVHLDSFPEFKNYEIQTELIKTMNFVRQICTATNSLRNKENIKIRQPLTLLTIFTSEKDSLNPFLDIIKEECNIKNITLCNELEKYSKKIISLNTKALSQRIPKKIQKLKKAISENKWEIKNNILFIENEKIQQNEYKTTIRPKLGNSNLVLGYHCFVVLNTKITEELKKEAIAKDIIRSVQEIRKKAKYNVSDIIQLKIKTKDQYIQDIINNYKDFIQKQTLSKMSENIFQKFETSLKLGDKIINIEVSN